MCVCVRVCVCVCMRACVHACMRACMCACVYVCECACVHVCGYACVGGVSARANTHQEGKSQPIPLVLRKTACSMQKLKKTKNKTLYRNGISESGDYECRACSGVYIEYMLI